MNKFRNNKAFVEKTKRIFQTKLQILVPYKLTINPDCPKLSSQLKKMSRNTINKATAHNRKTNHTFRCCYVCKNNKITIVSNLRKNVTIKLREKKPQLELNLASMLKYSSNIKVNVNGLCKGDRLLILYCFLQSVP